MNELDPEIEADVIEQLIDQASKGAMPHHVAALFKAIMPPIIAYVRQEDHDEAIDRFTDLPQIYATMICAICSGMFRAETMNEVMSEVGRHTVKALDAVGQRFAAENPTDEAEASAETAPH